MQFGSLQIHFSDAALNFNSCPFKKFNSLHYFILFSKVQLISKIKCKVFFALNILLQQQWD